MGAVAHLDCSNGTHVVISATNASDFITAVDLDCFFANVAVRHGYRAIRTSTVCLKASAVVLVTAIS